MQAGHTCAFFAAFLAVVSTVTVMVCVSFLLVEVTCSDGSFFKYAFIWVGRLYLQHWTTTRAQSRQTDGARLILM